MSGRRIDDHKFWAGGPGKDSVLPDGPHKVKTERSAEGSGHLGSKYPDTTEDIHKDQMMGDGKIKSHPIKSGYRN
jgi:hypothetical protein